MYLRLATKDDMELVRAWRSNPLIYQGFFTQKEPLTWEEHIVWWKSRNKDWREFIIVLDDRDIGVVSIGQLDHWTPEIGYFIGNPTDWGKGYGKKAVQLALEWLREYGKKYCHTTVVKSNKRSMSLLKSLGFKVVAEARKGEVWMTKKL